MIELMYSIVHFVSIHALTGFLVLGTGAGLSWATTRVLMKNR